MRNKITASLILIIFNVNNIFAGTPVIIENNSYSEIVECAGSASDIKSIIKGWFTKNYADINENIRMDEDIKLIFKCDICEKPKGISDHYSTTASSMITIDSKDNKFRISFEDISITFNSKRPVTLPYYDFVIGYNKDVDSFEVIRKENIELEEKYGSKKRPTAKQEIELSNSRKKLTSIYYKVTGDKQLIDDIKSTIRNIIDSLVAEIQKYEDF